MALRFSAGVWKPLLAGIALGLVMVAALSLLILAGGGTIERSAAVEGGPPSSTAAPPPALDQLFGGPFELVDQDGVTRTNADFSGRYMLIYFGYANCPNVCPLNMSTIAKALDRLGIAGEPITPVFVSIDPDRDTPDVVKAFVASFSPRFVGLTGTTEQVLAAAKAFQVHRRKVLVEGADAEKDYLVTHASLTHLMGPDGAHLTFFPHATDSAAMAERIRAYLPSGPKAPASGAS
jgi:protein SCO1/2